MKAILLRSLLLVALTGCGIFRSDEKVICNCCEISYANIDGALNCISQTQDNRTTSDNRLLLFAFVNGDLSKNQAAGWDIINDQDIVNVAKRNYLLIIRDRNDVRFLKEQVGSEFLRVIKSHDEDLFFVITNQALYPFADWSSKEKKEFIIDRLRVGIGP